MNSLKRQRIAVGDDGRGQKRACGDPFLLNRVQDERATAFQIASTTFTQAQGVPKRCIHKIATACNLPQVTCCACLDARLDSLGLMCFLEGLVCESNKRRWQYYCFGCQEYWDTQNTLGHCHRRPLAMAEVEDDVPNSIKISYGAEEVDITRSVDLTVDGLKAEVARIMQCQPGQLMVSDIALHKGGALPKISDDNALALCATYVKFARVTGVDSDDGAMEDVQYNRRVLGPWRQPAHSYA